MQFDLETTGLDSSHHRVFLVALRSPDGETETIEAQAGDDSAEADLLYHLAERVRAWDPDVIENHNTRATPGREDSLTLQLVRKSGGRPVPRASHLGVHRHFPVSGAPLKSLKDIPLKILKPTLRASSSAGGVTFLLSGCLPLGSLSTPMG